MAKRKKTARIDTQGKGDEPPAHNPFAEFFGTEAPAVAQTQASQSEPTSSALTYPQKALLRRTKKGRGARP